MARPVGSSQYREKDDPVVDEMVEDYDRQGGGDLAPIAAKYLDRVDGAHNEAKTRRLVGKLRQRLDEREEPPQDIGPLDPFTIALERLYTALARLPPNTRAFIVKRWSESDAQLMRYISLPLRSTRGVDYTMAQVVLVLAAAAEAENAYDELAKSATSNDD